MNALLALFGLIILAILLITGKIAFSPIVLVILIIFVVVIIVIGA